MSVERHQLGNDCRDEEGEDSGLDQSAITLDKAYIGGAKFPGLPK